MNRLGIQSLNAGAPDLRLTGDQTQRGGTYTQRRRNQMAYGGIAGLDGRKAYGIGSWFQEKIKDPIKEKFVDPAIDFVTENPLLTAGGIGLGINQFGIPGMDKAGQGWISDLIGGGQNLIGKGITGAKKMMGIGPGISGMDDAGLDPRWRELLAKQASTGALGNLSTTAINQLQRIMKGNAPGLLGLGQYGDPVTGAIGDQFKQWLGGQQQQQNQLDQQRELQRINWEVPLAGGAFAHEYQKKYLEDQPPFPGDETNIKFQTAKQVMEDEGQRIKPQEKYVLPSALAAEGGRIGYNRGRVVNPGGYAGELSGSELFLKLYQEGKIDNLQQAMEDANRYDAGETTNYEKHTGNNPLDMYQKYSDPSEVSLGSGLAEEAKQNVISKTDEIRSAIEESGVLDDLDLKAQGGRIGYRYGQGVESVPTDQMEAIKGQTAGPDWFTRRVQDLMQFEGLSYEEASDQAYEEGPAGGTDYAQGGRIGFADGTPKMPKVDTDNILKKLEKFIKEREGYEDAIFRSERIDAQEGGLMNLGGMEKDYRQEGGFVPIGGQEKADDVPARLSKNEFVFTADAVRNAGGGDIDAGAEVMENLMEHLEAGGEVSEDSQGLEGARGMFANAQALEKRII